jgi:hypothetical protein
VVKVRLGFIHAWVFPCFGRYGILKQHRVLRGGNIMMKPFYHEKKSTLKVGS